MSVMARNRKSDRERLLKLIDGAPAAETGAAREETAGTATKRVRMGFDAIVSGLRRGSFDKGVVLLWVNRGLVAALACIVIYGLFDLSRALTGANKVPALVLPAVQAVSRPAVVAASSAALSSFAGIFDQARVAGGSQASSAAPAEQESASGLRLVGVDWGGDEPVALVEDKATGKTYFKKKDEKVGEWQVIRILRKKVVLSGPGGETEIQ